LFLALAAYSHFFELAQMFQFCTALVSFCHCLGLANALADTSEVTNIRGWSKNIYTNLLCRTSACKAKQTAI